MDCFFPSHNMSRAWVALLFVNWGGGLVEGKGWCGGWCGRARVKGAAAYPFLWDDSMLVGKRHCEVGEEEEEQWGGFQTRDNGR